MLGLASGWSCTRCFMGCLENWMDRLKVFELCCCVLGMCSAASVVGLGLRFVKTCSACLCDQGVGAD
jgi:hypothetical protein